MKQFGNITSFVEHLAALAVAEEHAARDGLQKAAKIVEKCAKQKIGMYQEQYDPFIAWPELAEATLHGGVAPSGFHYPGKIELGYATEDDPNPLLRTGDLRDSIGIATSTDGLEVQIGSNEDVAVWQELGTRYMPPRSFLGGAMAEKLPNIKEIISRKFIAALMGEEVFEGRLFIEG